MAADLEALTGDLAEARAALRAAIEGVTREDLLRVSPGTAGGEATHTNARDVLWHAGLLDDWYRLLINRALAGQPLPPWQDRMRPDYVDTPELLSAWLEQTRGALLARVRRLSDAELDFEFTPPGDASTTPRRLLSGLATHDRDAAAQIRALLASGR